jgi:hypothetical protein
MFVKYLSVEFVITKIEGCVDGSERFEINVNFLFFSLIGDDCSAVDN